MAKHSIKEQSPAQTSRCQRNNRGDRVPEANKGPICSCTASNAEHLELKKMLITDCLNSRHVAMAKTISNSTLPASTYEEPMYTHLKPKEHTQ